MNREQFDDWCSAWGDFPDDGYRIECLAKWAKKAWDVVVAARGLISEWDAPVRDQTMVQARSGQLRTSVGMLDHVIREIDADLDHAFDKAIQTTVKPAQAGEE